VLWGSDLSLTFFTESKSEISKVLSNHRLLRLQLERNGVTQQKQFNKSFQEEMMNPNEVYEKMPEELKKTFSKEQFQKAAENIAKTLDKKQTEMKKKEIVENPKF
jgi:hypothetical protein